MRFAIPAVTALFLGAALTASAQQGKPLAIKKGVNEVDIKEGKYWMDVPNSYNPKVPTPVIVFLHGKTIDLKADNGRPQLDNAFVTGLKKKGWVAVAPVMPTEHRPHWFENGGSLEIVDAMMIDLAKRVNCQFIVCSGFSAGANYTMSFGQRDQYYEHFVGYLVIAGGGFIDKGAKDEIKRRPIWQGCGDKDEDMWDDKMNTTGGARQTAKELKEAGFESSYDEFPKVGHVMDAKMVDKALAFVDANVGTFAAIGAYTKAGKLHESDPGEALRALEGAVNLKKVADFWKKKCDAGITGLVERAKQDIATAAAETDTKKAKDDLSKLAEAYHGTSVEKLAKDAWGKVGAAK